MSVATQKIDKINDCSFWPADLFICCSSFEDRCLTIPSAIRSDNITKALIVENKNICQAGKNATLLREKYFNKYVDVDTSTIDPLMTADNLRRALEISTLQGSHQSIVVDITTFTHESLLILLNLLKSKMTMGDSVTLLYNSAMDYSTNSVSVQEKWLSKGVSGVRTVLGYPGDIQPTKKMHLILFVGYEYLRATKLIEILEPSMISLGYGRQGTATNQTHENASEYFHNLVKGMALQYAHVNCFPFSCSDPYEVKDTILQIVSNYPDENIVVAPMNTKLSAIGTGLAAIENRSIQLCYAPAMQYNFDNYSSSSDTCYYIQLK